jgi:acyl-coenzyme A thioesterase PaaI-like protein
MGHVPEGWVAQPRTAFDALVGAFYFPPGDGTYTCGFLADARHANTRDTVHGGMVTAAFDFALGVAAKTAAGERPCATVQLNVHFIDAMKLGEFAILRIEPIRTTRSLVFLRGTLRASDRTIAAADSVWKILQRRD